MSSDNPPLLRPRPRRPFELTPLSSTAPSSPEAPSPNEPTATADDAPNFPPSRTRSILNLTSSTLFGIYSPAGYTPDKDESVTPWSTGAMTPIDSKGVSVELDGQSVDEALMMRSKERRGSMLDQSTKFPKSGGTRKTSNPIKKRRKGLTNYYLPLLGKTALLSAVGAAYGLMISHLHDQQHLAPVQVDGIPHQSWGYLGFWSVVSMLIGNLMPFVDDMWEGEETHRSNEAEREYRTSGNLKSSQDRPSGRNSRKRSWSPEWNEVVRTIGIFVGVAFAIRRLPWQSPLQLSLTLALANPAIWYLLDRTPPGFILSTTVALTGTALILAINPALIPSASATASTTTTGMYGGNVTVRKGTAGVAEQAGLVLGMFSQESVGVSTWIASVIFVSCICFGNIGRRL